MRSTVASPVPDFSAAIFDDAQERHHLTLAVDGMRCASCSAMIEHILNKEGVEARVSITEKRLQLNWRGERARFRELLAPVIEHGFRLAQYEEAGESEKQRKEEHFLLACLAVAGLATTIVMLMHWQGMANEGMGHYLPILIALPATVFAGIPFFRSAWQVLRKGHTNMDVPIALAVILSSGLGLVQTLQHAEHTYADSAIMLLFFLLVGRFLDLKTRGTARSAARDLLLLMSGEATLLANGTTRRIPVRDIRSGMSLLVTAGEKILADGTVAQGTSEVDNSLLTGETLPQLVTVGANVFAGMINLSAPLTITVSVENRESLLSDIVRLMEKAEQAQAKYVRLADKVARAYAPAVHILALGTLLGWLLLTNASFMQALVTAISVLIITCPCALGLAVPVVQVLASKRLFKQGILLKSSDALERLTEVDTILFDKTGTLTLGRPRLVNMEEIPAALLEKAVMMAKLSRHPLSEAVAASMPNVQPLPAITEIPGSGLEATVDGKVWRLGSRVFCAVEAPADDEALELWLRIAEQPPIRFVFADTLRSDTAETIRHLKQKGYHLALLSGDRESVAEKLGAQLGFDEARGGMSPQAKHEAVSSLLATGHKVLYVGDGLNDAAALSVATVSLSPSTALDISQNAAAIVFQGTKLSPVITALETAKEAQALVKQNFVLAIIYNIFAVPMAVAGLVTPMIAAIAMSLSSIAVIFNALRLQLRKPKTR
jgi:Cu2+-exporting ATPase